MLSYRATHASQSRCFSGSSQGHSLLSRLVSTERGLQQARGIALDAKPAYSQAGLRPVKNSRNGSMLGVSPASSSPLRSAAIWWSWIRWVGIRSGPPL